MLRFILLLLAFLTTSVLAHETRPGYLGLKETTSNSYAVHWTWPKGNARSDVFPVFPEYCQNTKKINLLEQSYFKYSWQLNCSETLAGATITFPHIESTLIEVLINFTDLNNKYSSYRITPQSPSVKLTSEANFISVASTYLIIGIKHIVFGFDHLCFVIALLLVINNIKQLVLCISAFTLAHSISLAFTALNIISIPSAPIEALIAFSIVLVAYQYVAANQSMKDHQTWRFSFLVGLIHGVGFAGALAEIGLPKDAIISALIFFNLGVELGQLFVVVMFLFIFNNLFRKYSPLKHSVYNSIAYLLGTLGMYWTIERFTSIIL